MDHVRRAQRDYPTAIGLTIVHVGALAAFAPALFSWPAVALAIFLFWLCGGIGITLGYHRMLTHRSLAMPRPVEYAIALCGTLALQGGPIEWVATHRKHHAHTDRDGDPHDSHRGMGWAHVEWLYRTNKDRLAPDEWARWAPDLTRDPYYRFLNKHSAWIQVAFGALLFAIGGWPFVVWGIFFRLAVLYHCTWLVNSAAHATGYQSFRTGDRSTNCWWVALVAFGEGWHNNH
ncbi:MAG: acyl-CoA desaturase, partial [Vulcanimicrobiaceae bacterium]